jgi:hypothetical protein
MKIINSALNRQYAKEADILEKALEWLSKQPNLKAIRICDKYNSGYSDIFICVEGKLVVAELKSATGKPSKLQLEFIAEMQRCGATGGICRSIQDIKTLLEEACGRA